MDLINFAQIVLRRWWVVVLFIMIGITSAYYLATNAPTRYQSTVSLQLNPAARSSFLPYQADATVSASGPVVAQAASYREVLRSRAFGQVIVQQLKLDVPPEMLAGAITTQLVQNTNILHLSVTWDNPSDAQQLAQRIAELFIVENQRRQLSQPGTQTQLANMEQSARDIQARLAPLQQQRDRLDDVVARGDLSQLNELTAVDTRFTALESSYANLLVEISRVRSSFDTAVILDSATPGAPIDALPLVQALVFGVLGGISAGGALIVTVERLADVVRTPGDVVSATAVPLLGRLGHANTWRWRRSGCSNALVMLRQSSPTVEAIRSLRAALQFGTPSRSLRSLVVTSGGPREGKTFVASNLAISLAEAGNRVLLVDGNLHRPALHTWFGVPNRAGLSDLLTRARKGELDDAHVTGVVETGVNNLWLLPSGALPPNRGELLSSDAVATVIEQLGRKWEAVILDTAHIGLVADTVLLAHQASGCVLVARCGKTRKAGLHGTLAALNGVAGRVVGVVLNDYRPGILARFSAENYYSYLSTASHDETENGAVIAHHGRTDSRALREFTVNRAGIERTES